MSTEPFDRYADYDRAMLTLLGRAEKHLGIFDPDLKTGPIASLQGVGRLEAMLHADPKAEVVLLLHDTTHLAARCPRLLNLFRQRGHQFRILVTAQEHRSQMQPFAIADGVHMITRFHADQARGKLCLHEAVETAAFEQRFDALLENAAPASGLATLDI